MTDKKISRRDFIHRLVVCSVAIPLAPLLIKEEPKVFDVVGMVDKPLDVGRRTARVGMPEVTWRKLHEGVDPDKTLLEMARDSKICKNDILADLTWKEVL